ncbi:2556_t:CDS:10 [Paraglomus occultum]|uniref:2556_t:CDS:1 n=1 Tax=Paraglomus occultum TaxID=144539 RepID=A0A9N8Z292_9GLOM|nr:2556_t:CDS:10 [Paraglomus occultum]
MQYLPLPINLDLLDQLVYEYLRHEGIINEETVINEWNKTYNKCTHNVEKLCKINEIRQLINKGEIQAAFECINQVYPELLLKPRLTFRLYKQQFIELSRDKQITNATALEYLQRHLAPCALSSDPHAFTEFQQTLLSLVLGNNTTDLEMNNNTSNNDFDSILSKDNSDSSVKLPQKSTNKLSDDWSIRKREELADDIYSVLLRSMGIRESILALGIRYVYEKRTQESKREEASLPEAAQLLLPERDDEDENVSQMDGIYEELDTNDMEIDQEAVMLLAQTVGISRLQARTSIKRAHGSSSEALFNELSRMRISRSLLNELCLNYYGQRIAFPFSSQPLPSYSLHSNSSSSMLTPSAISLNTYQPQSGDDSIERVGIYVQEIVMKGEGNVAKRVLEHLSTSGVTSVYDKLCEWNRDYEGGKCKNANLRERKIGGKQKNWSKDNDKYIGKDPIKDNNHVGRNGNFEDKSENETIDDACATFPYEDLEKTPVSPRLWFAWKQCEFLEHLRVNEWDQAMRILREEMNIKCAFVSLLPIPNHPPVSSRPGPLTITYPDLLDSLKDCTLLIVYRNSTKTPFNPHILIRPLLTSLASSSYSPSATSSKDATSQPSLPSPIVPSLVVLFSHLLDIHSKWFEYQQSEDIFQSLFYLDELKKLEYFRVPLRLRNNESTSNMDEGIVEDNEDDVMMLEDEFGEEELRMAEANAVRFNIADNVITHIQEVMAWSRVQAINMLIEHGGNPETLLNAIF